MSDNTGLITMTEIKSVEDAKTAFLGAHRELAAFAEKASKEVAESGRLATETKNALETLSAKANGMFDRFEVLEAKMNRRNPLHAGSPEESLGAKAVKSEGFVSFMSRRAKSANFASKAIINVPGQNQPLVPAMRAPGIVYSPDRMFTIRDLLPVSRTTSNLIEYTKELLYTNNAAPQYVLSPEEREGVLKSESNITFVLATAAVVTIAHFVIASKQVLDDAPMLQSYIDNRLVYGLKLEEEDEILNGTGTAGTINGLRNQAVAYNRGQIGDTKIDTVRRSVTQGQIAEYPMDALVLNPADWEEIELTRDEADGRYTLASPIMLADPRLWGLRVVATNSMPAGNWLTGAFRMGATLWDREDANVQVSLEDSDNFRRNLVTIRAEERIALTVERPQAFVKGTW